MDYTKRLSHHYQPKSGWINDPNGLVYFKGYYHIFYQHAPHFETPWHEPMYWGHARTKDFLSFEELPVALTPDKPYDKDGCWSGTAIVKDDTLYLFYASVRKNDDTPAWDDNGRIESVSVAFSKDGINFEKYEGNPIIKTYPADGGNNFRDPAVMEKDGKYFDKETGEELTQVIAKMSKSLKNVINPDDFIRNYGAGIKRFWS